ncbi:MAG: hypothetical protein QM722_14255 [Piscinibacter sp.]
MKPQHIAGLAAAAAIGGLVGWQMQPSPSAAPSRAATIATSPAAATQAVTDTSPQIIIASDGNATIHVEQQPLAWVLEQIAKHSGWSDVHARATPAAASGVPAGSGDAPAEVVAVAEAPRDEAQVLQAISRGGEADRFDGLMAARSSGIALTDELLKTVFESDASERVRLAAFETFLEGHSGDGAALRSALSAALYVPNPAIQREARQRLDELDESERIDAATRQTAAP